MEIKINSRTVTQLQPREKPFDVNDTELIGFGIRVQPSGVMTYFASYLRPNCRRRTRVKISRVGILNAAQARDQALIALSEVARGIDPAVTKKRDQNLLLRNFIDNKYSPWIHTHSKSGHLTVRMIKVGFAQFLDKPIDQISAWTIDQWKSNLISTGLKSSSVNRYLNALRAALSKAVEWQVIDAHPLKGVKKCPELDNSRVRYLSIAEEIRLRSAMEDRESKKRTERTNHNLWLAARGYTLLNEIQINEFADHLKPMVLLSINCGLRRGELFSLEWKDLNFKSNVLTIRAETTKSSKTRYIPLNKEATSSLTQWRRQSDALAGFIFPNIDGKRFDNISSSWKGLLKLSEIENFRWHDMRHHFASRLVMAGVDINTVRELLGHSSLKMTLRYAHLAPEVKAEAVAKLDTQSSWGSYAINL